MTNVLHRIKAYLYKNKFTENPDEYTARVVTERLLNVKDVCQSAVTRGGANNISSYTMQYAVDLFLKEMVYRLCDGYAVNTGYFTLKALVKGVFESPDEQFNPEKHRIRLLFMENEKLREALSEVELQILGLSKSGLYITQVTDSKTGAVNGQITPGHTIIIAGNMLKITGNRSDTGIYFVNSGTGERTKVDFADIVKNHPSELIVMIPMLGTGGYWLEVTTSFTTSGMLKQPRTTMLDCELKIASLSASG